MMFNDDFTIVNTRDMALNLYSTTDKEKVVHREEMKAKVISDRMQVEELPEIADYEIPKLGKSEMMEFEITTKDRPDKVGRPPDATLKHSHAITGKNPIKTPGLEKTPGKSRGKTPGKRPSVIYIGNAAKTSSRSKVQAMTPGRSSATTSSKSKVKSQVSSQGINPERSPTKTSDKNKVNTPGSSQLMSPDRSSANTSGRSKVKPPGSSQAMIPDRSPAKTSSKSKVKTPVSSQEMIPEMSPAKTSDKNKVNTPGSSQVMTPNRSSAKTSGRSKVKTPGSSQAMTPDMSSAKTSGRSELKTQDKTPAKTPGKSPSKSLRRRLCFEKSDSGSESEEIDSDDGDEWGAYCTESVNVRQLRQQVSEEDQLVPEELFDQEVSEEVILLNNDAITETIAETTGVNKPKNVESLEISKTFSFTKDFSTFTGQPEMYLNTPGSRLTVKDPTGLFLAVWDNDIIEYIVKETNAYAWQTIRKFSETGQSPNLDTEWRETTVEEIYRLFALLNYMSIDFRSSIDEYWTTGILSMPEFRKIMSRNRFKLLMKFLHFVNNNTLQKQAYDRKISKIAPILDHCNRKFSSMYTPHRSLSLDESLLLWKGRLSFAQTIRTKAARFGIKSFELCESQSGYLLRSLLYAGKMREGAIDGFENPTAKVVLELMDGFLDVGHMLVMDNWYNQLCLTRYLKKRHTDVVGTMNRRRVDVPNVIKYLNEHRMRPGDQVSLHCGDITMIAWKDLKLVTAISTFHNADVITCQRQGNLFNKPEIIECYNKNMGGVDMKDQKLSMYMFERKRLSKWYMKVFRRLLNTSILNAYIIYTSGYDSVDPSKCTHREFRYRVSEGLLATFKLVKIPKPLSKPKIKVPLPDEIRLKRDAEYDHLPILTKEPESSTARLKRRRCAYCSSQGKRSLSSNVCRTCDVGLCIECWVDYHTKPVLCPKNIKPKPKL